MRVSLAAKAIFYFPVSLKLVRQLCELSKRHYDGECQRASGRIGRPLYPGSTVNHARNGVLTIWHDRFENDAMDGDVTEVRCTWDDLDLVAKICEYPPSDMATGGPWTEARVLKDQISKMFEVAGPKVMKDWKTEFDV